jgi:VIT1/CCC1 family predicted Fe2+/Mn2+ transporter
MLVADSRTALLWSALLTLLALIAFGAVKGRFTGVSVWKSALQTSTIGAAAAFVAFVLARLVSGQSAGV